METALAVIITVLRWLAFVAGLFGWFAFVSRCTSVTSAFLPVITVSGLTVTLFTFGMLHLLQPAAWILFGCGLALLLFFFIQALRKRFSFAFLLSPGMVFFVLASALFIPILWGVHYYHYDNFSHWGTVLSEMLSFNDFPTARTVVVFRDYAPGTASFLYWFCTVVGRAEDISLMGQAMISCAALSALFFRTKKIRSVRFWTGCLLALILTCLLKFDDGTLQVFNLLVDAQMGFVCVSLWFLREEYKDRPLFLWFCMIPLMTFLILIKSNGALLLAFFGLLLLYDAKKSSFPRRKKILCLVPLAVAALWYSFWKFYRDLTYGTVTNSYALQEERDWSFYQGVFRVFWAKISDLSLIYVQVFLLLNALVIGLLILMRIKKKNGSLLYRSFLLANGLMLGYTAALLFMYCFIMATGEASYLAAFERYIITPLILFVVILVHGLTETLFHSWEKRSFWLRLAPLWVCLLLFCLVAGQASQLILRPEFESTERGKVMEVLQQASTVVPRNSKVAMVNGERGRRDMYYYLMMYEMKSRMCFVWDFAQPEYDIETDAGMIQQYEYLIIASKHYRIVSALRRAGYSVVWNKDCSVYRISQGYDGRCVITPVEMNFSDP